MKSLLRIEYLFLLILGGFAFAQTHWSWWWYLGLFLLPDISMLGYVVNPKTGAYLYNIFHYYATAILAYLGGVYSGNDYLMAAGAILFSHTSFDRLLGYGLKYTDAFQHTHLGRIGKDKM